jgi:hypothetical protein
VRAALAKTLCVLGAAVAFLKRASLPAATVTVAVLGVLLVTAPHDDPVPAPGLRSHAPQRSSARAFAEAPKGTPRGQLSLSRPTWATARRAGTPAPPRRTDRPQARVQTPVVGVEVQNRDDGHQSSTVVGRVQHCLENLRIELHYQGCDTSTT